MSGYVIVIPARLKSSRLPDKPLLDVAGKTLLERTYDRAMASNANRVVIATDHSSIFDKAKQLGAEVYLSRTTHSCGTDRIAECVGLAKIPDGTVCVNLQVDEPQMPTACLDQVASGLEDAVCKTLAVQSRELAEFEDPNVVKVVTNVAGKALYFSRSPIPYERDREDNSPEGKFGTRAFLRHVGLYAYESAFLQQFSRLKPAPSEKLEHLEQLRILHYGYSIQVAVAAEPIPPGVDTQADLDRVRRAFAANVFT